MMYESTEKIISKLSNEYFDGATIDYSVDVTGDDNILTIGGEEYEIPHNLQDEDIDERVSYIYNNLSDEAKKSVVLVKEGLTDNVNNEEKTPESIIAGDDEDKGFVDKVYIYNPSYVDSHAENDVKLHNYVGLPCKVVEKLVTSKEEEDEFVLVTFDIDENVDNEDVDDETYIIFVSDLAPYDNAVRVSEALNTNSEATTTALLTALNSEKEAVLVYETLINNTIDEDEILLLSRILDDEKEHIALLSALLSSKSAEFVTEDNKNELDEYAQEVIDTEPATEGVEEDEV